MRQIVDDRRAEYRKPTHLEVLPRGRDTRARDLRQKKLAVMAKTDRKARAKLLAELYPLVQKQAHKQRGLGVEYDDLVQAGMEGAMRAIRAYTPRQEAAFSTYAFWWIHGAMRWTIAWHRRTIRVPKYRVLIAGKERKARERLQLELGRAPKDHEVAQAMGVDVRAVWRIYDESAPLASVDAMMTPADEDDPQPTAAEMRYLQDPTGNPERYVMGRVLPEEMRKALKKLQRRDRRVLRMRYWNDLPRREIAERLGISVEAVRWSEDRGLEMLGGEKSLREYWKFFVE
jgi:RNA polymerase sigma factor (sigma-70 family)